MLKVLLPANATKATIRAVVRFLFIGHPEIAYVAMILAELYVAIPACVGFTTLSSKALATNDFANAESINRVVIVLHDCE